MLEAIYTLDSKVLRALCATCDKSDCGYKARKIPVKSFASRKKIENLQQNLDCFFALA